MIELTLPMPPSVNAMFKDRRAGGGRTRAKSKKYRDWLIEAGTILMIQRPPKITGDVVVDYTFGPRHRLADVFNREKAVSDLLVKHGVIEDDRRIVDGRVRWGDVQGVRVRVGSA